MRRYLTFINIYALAAVLFLSVLGWVAFKEYHGEIERGVCTLMMVGWIVLTFPILLARFREL